MTAPPRNGANPLVTLAEDRLQHHDYHGSRMWRWNGWLSGWALVVNVLVPFGVASLLYIPEAYRNTLNVISLALSGLALALQLLIVVQRFKDRALQLRLLYTELASALAEYRVGVKTDAEFSRVLERVMKKHAEEPAP